MSRNLDPALKERLRVRAAEHGHSMEAEARRILQTARAVRDARKATTFTSAERAREPPRFD